MIGSFGNWSRYVVTVVFAILIFAAGAYADDSRINKVRFAYDVDFEMDFDNRELYKSAFSSSMTIFGARLTPSVGIDVNTKDGSSHKVMIGVDVMKDFGGQSSNLFREITLYYKYHKSFEKTDLTVNAGVFPRRFSEASYSHAFFSDSLKFYDNNLEGILLQFRRPSAYYEVGCDWMGMFGNERRERFMVFAGGYGKVHPLVELGFSAYLYHFACSAQVDGVVDNILVNPYVKLDFAKLTPFQELSVRGGWLQSAQNDRRYVGKYVFPGGLEVITDIRKWNVGIRNTFFFGKDMMPYYNRLDAGGIKYGNMLYMGEPFFRVHDNGRTDWGVYDRLEAYYEPVIGNFLAVKVGAIFHFNGKYSGCQQIVSLKFNLQRLLNKQSKNQ